MKIDKEKLSPMMKKYLETKEEYSDCILFYRLGDFYEMFFDDALLAAKVLNIALTGKACGLEERAPMCGVPFHSVNSYLSKMVEAGYKVAIAEQVEDPALVTGIVKREVVKIVTPGTLLENEDDENTNSYLMSIYNDNNGYVGIAYFDIKTGELNCSKFPAKQIKEEVAKISPSEIISNDVNIFSDLEQIAKLSNIYLNRNIDESLFEKDILFEKFEKEYLLSKQIYNDDLLEKSISMVLNYIKKTQMIESSNINSINVYKSDDFMKLDLFTRVNLELTETIRGRNKSGSLLKVLDFTSTPMGARMLKKHIEQPLTNIEKINKRLNIIDDIKNDFALKQDLKSSLSNIYDLERICAKIAYERVTPKDLINLKNSIQMIPGILSIVKNSDSENVKKVIDSLDSLNDIYELIERSILDEPSNNIKDGSIIKSEYSNELAELRDISSNGAYLVQEIEKKEKELTGAKTLKVGYNKVFGYYIEITKVALTQAKLDERYIRKQTLVNAERFITTELKEIEDKIINAEDKIKNIEYKIFNDIRNEIYNNIDRIQIVANVIAELDVYVSSAIVASKYNYVKPNINNFGVLKIIDGRHPVIEQIIGSENFISNSTNINNDNSINIITGPNMSGKSTYMRQTALICLMAHIGTFVPAEFADIPIMDRIFTRVGASDDLAQGQSTFMVEMNEVSLILSNATKDSLIILDEVGRGTSTYDGISLAWSIVEYIHDNIGAKTLFATHYHELTELENKYSNIKNYSIQVKEDGDNIIFLRKIIPNAADRSYGIYVAKLAKLPDKVISRADSILIELEKNHIYNSSSIDKYYNADSADVKLSSIMQNNNSDKNTKENLQDGEINKSTQKSAELYDIVNEIAELDLMNYTPIDMINKLYELQKKAKLVR